MTADRWWVRAAARWIARIDSVKGHLNLVFTAMTGVGVASGALKYYGLGSVAPVFIGVTAVGMLGYAYLYAEGGVWNQVSRDRIDMSNNFSEPRDLVGHRIGLQQLAYVGYLAQNGRDKNLEEIVAEMEDLTHEEWADLRDGVPLEDIEQSYQ